MWILSLLVGQWGQCVGEECGTAGVQTRTAWCVHTEGWTAHHNHCQHADKPEVERRCFKVCDWHQDLFRWEMSNWGSCALVSLLASNELAPASRTADCVTAQHGIQRREVHCARTSNGTAVSSRICEFFSPKPPMEQACLIPCPQDCVVSDFTPWSSCSKTCGAGLQHRTRHVLATPMFGGAKCPNLTETRTCAGAAECPAGEGEHQYSLKAGPWAECRLPHHKDALLSGRTTVDFSSTTSSENNSVTQHSQPATLKQRSPHHLHHHHHHHPPVHNRYCTVLHFFLIQSTCCTIWTHCNNKYILLITVCTGTHCCGSWRWDIRPGNSAVPGVTARMPC